MPNSLMLPLHGKAQSNIFLKERGKTQLGTKCKKGGEKASRWPIKRTLGSSPLKNTSKLQLHVEKPSLKLTWGPAEQFFHHQKKKKIKIHEKESGRKGRDVI